MIAQYETGRRKPKIDTLRKICSAMGITIGELGGEIWEFYTPQEFAEDWTDCANTAVSKIPKQIESSINQAVKKTSKNLQQASEQAELHAHEIVDSDWRCIFLLHDYEQLNSTGRSEAQKRINELTEIKKYTEKEPEDSE